MRFKEYKDMIETRDEKERKEAEMQDRSLNITLIIKNEKTQTLKKSIEN